MTDTHVSLTPLKFLKHTLHIFKKLLFFVQFFQTLPISGNERGGNEANKH